MIVPIQSGKSPFARLSAWVLLLLCFGTVHAQLLQDPSFELLPATAPGAEWSWSVCRGTPDWQVLDGFGTGINGVATPAASGARYIGLLDTEFDLREAVGQALNLESGIHHFGSVALFRSTAHQSWNGTGQLQLWGGSACGDFAELLWSSGTVNNVDNWQTFSINFSASGNHQWIMATLVLDPGSGEMTYLGMDDLRLDNAFLAVDYLALEAKPMPKGVQLNWEVVPLVEAAQLDVEWSTDGTNFAQIGQVQADVDASEFAFFHAPSISGTQFYRIKSVDAGGYARWSEVIQTQWSPSAEALIYPNPIQNSFRVQMPVASAMAKIELLDLQGRLVAEWSGLDLSQHEFTVPSTVGNGCYSLKITEKSMQNQLRVVILR
jgi:hypothetical protein